MAMANANITAMKDQLRNMAEEIAKLKDQIPPMEPMLFFVVLVLLALIFVYLISTSPFMYPYPLGTSFASIENIFLYMNLFICRSSQEKSRIKSKIAS